jgi:hypothetical protein
VVITHRPSLLKLIKAHHHRRGRGGIVADGPRDEILKRITRSKAA